MCLKDTWYTIFYFVVSVLFLIDGDNHGLVWSSLCGRLNSYKHLIVISYPSTWKSSKSKFIIFVAVKVKPCFLVHNDQ